MSLQTLYLMPTLACNCRCTYCYIPEEERARSAAPPDFVPLLAAFLQEAEAAAQLRFVGGEPLLLPALVAELTALFVQARPEGLVVVNSNGTLLTQETVAPFVPLAGRMLFVVSLDGLQPVHDSRRRLLSGESAFAAAMRGITLLGEAGIRVVCNMVLDGANGAQLGTFFDFLAGELGMHEVSVSLNSRPKGEFPVEEKIGLLKAAYHAAARAGLAVSGHHRLLLGHRIPELRCRAGEKTVLFTPDLRAFACQRFVGQMAAATWTPGVAVASLVDGGAARACCGGAETLALGNALYEFYEREYPQYLRLNTLDRLLFGVL